MCARTGRSDRAAPAVSACGWAAPAKHKALDEARKMISAMTASLIRLCSRRLVVVPQCCATTRIEFGKTYKPILSAAARPRNFHSLAHRRN